MNRATSPRSLATWRKLAAHAQRLRDPAARVAAGQASPRGQRLRLEGLEVDFSGQFLDPVALAALLSLTRQRALRRGIRDLFAGAPVNFTEGRAALHPALRAPPRSSFRVRGRDVLPAVLRERHRMLAWATRLRNGSWRGATGEKIRELVILGCGGSELGARLVCHALGPTTGQQATPRIHFVSGMDGAQLADLLPVLRPEQSLFVVASKSMTTPDTLANAAAALAWLRAAPWPNPSGAARHCVAITAQPQEATRRLGVAPSRVLRIWDWVGGRYSLWSAMGLPIAVAIGEQAFLQLLAGAHELDRHFLRAPLERNLPVLLALLDTWNTNFLRIDNKIVLPYDHDLRDLPAYLSQLEMESLGKTLRADNTPVDYRTGGAVWGDLGFNARHSFLQLLHQGNLPVALELVLVETPRRRAAAAQHRAAREAALLQSAYFAHGRKHPEAAKCYAGGRPQKQIRLRRLTARWLGMLLAAYEHKVYSQSLIWGVNAFDQHSVDHGKRA